MNINIERANFFYLLITLFVLFPVFFSTFFALISVKIPSYAIISLFGFFVILVAFSTTKCFSRIQYFISIRNVFFMFFLIWVYLSYTYTPSDLYAKEKILSFTYNTVLPVTIIMFSFIFCKNAGLNIAKVEKSIYLYSVLLLIACAFILVLFGNPDQDGRTMLPGIDNPIWVSRFFGTILVVLLCQELKRIILPKSIMLILLCIVCMFISGSRTPLIGALSVFIFMLAYRKGWGAIFKITIPFGLFFLIFFLVFRESYIFDTNFYSLFHRFEILKSASLMIKDLPLLGYGFGSYGMVFLGEDINYYPHNIFVELLFETGYVGFLMFNVMLFCFYRKFSGNILECLFIYYLILSMTSGDLPGNNVLLILFFLCGLFTNAKHYRGANNEERVVSLT